MSVLTRARGPPMDGLLRPPWFASSVALTPHIIIKLTHGVAERRSEYFRASKGDYS